MAPPKQNQTKELGLAAYKADALPTVLSCPLPRTINDREGLHMPPHCRSIYFSFYPAAFLYALIIFLWRNVFIFTSFPFVNLLYAFSALWLQ